MWRLRYIEILVGLFLLAGIIALVVLAFRVSGLTSYIGKDSYYVTARFTEIGGLKVRSQVSLAGVRIGEVTAIDLDPESFTAKVTLLIDGSTNIIPNDSSARILTEGLLGANYVGITPGFSEENLSAGDEIDETYPAILLENLIGQLIFNADQDEE